MHRTSTALALSSAVGLPQPWPVEESFGWYLLQFGWMINVQQRCKFRHQGSNKKINIYNGVATFMGDTLDAKCAAFSSAAALAFAALACQ